MLAKNAGARPVMPAVAGHPLWWSAEQQLQFLVDISDRCVCGGGGGGRGGACWQAGEEAAG